MKITVFNKKAAMFGLDARIALAIFGALSVISGAALYSAIQESKVVSLVAELNEISKAVESYMLDTGQDLPIWESSDQSNANALLINYDNVVGWNGPYLSGSFTATSGSHTLSGNSYEYFHVLLFGKLNESTGERILCSDTLPCYQWIMLGKVTDSLAKKVDLYVDGTDSPKTGKISHVNFDGDDDFENLYYKSVKSFYKTQPFLF